MDPLLLVPDPGSRGVLHQPLAAGPCTRKKGLFPGFPGDPPFWGILLIFALFGAKMGILGPRALVWLPDPGGASGGAAGPRREGLM